MGVKNTKIKKNKNILKKSLENKELFKQNQYLSHNPNPCFKKNEIFSDIKCIDFEIFNLKNINNAFYLVFTPYGEFNDTLIYKYFYEKDQFLIINSIKFKKKDLSHLIIKYFYNPLNKKEYLFFLKDYNDIEIFLIKKENKFESIKKTGYNYLIYELGDSVERVYEIELFEIIYNQYDNNIYIVISYFLRKNKNINASNNIRILSFKNDKLIIIKDFEFTMNNSYDISNEGKINLSKLMKIIYEDKYSKKYYILMLIKNNLQFIEIKNNYKQNYQIDNFFESENDLQQFKETIKDQIDFKGCIISTPINNYNNDYLYLYFKEEIFLFEDDLSDGNFIIIDLLNKKIIKKIKIFKYVESILNWNNKYLILQSEISFYIFDTKINKIISRYSNLSGNKSYLKSIKAFFDIKDNFYCLFADKGNINFFISN